MKKIVKYTVTFLVMTGIFFSLQRLLVPKYMSDVYDGALIGEYYAEKKNHSVIFIGDCEVYQNFIPAELFREFGITSYIRGSASQTMWQSYFLLEDTLRHETPEVVVLSVLGMNKSEAVSEPYNRLNIEGMRLSPSKIGAIRASAVEGESVMSYLFPIFRYHERWNNLSRDDFKYFFGTDNVGLNGYLMRSETVPPGNIPKPIHPDSYKFDDVCFEYLDKIRELCESNGIDLVLVKAPSLSPHWFDGWESQIADYAAEYSLTYYNYLNLTEDTGIDYSTDTANGGLHMNVSGAKKLTHSLGESLTASHDLYDYRNDNAVAAVWERKIADYERLHEIQLSEFERDGKVVTVTYKKSP
ncbi:MAG: SGNH/GDSL hydrolase family protein [Oscillospiraceae bacterium]|nr:SGNH/GDSL hydrolase family protein [Oscillospiraceae bacterium]